jgi:hypothetical protein
MHQSTDPSAQTELNQLAPATLDELPQTQIASENAGLIASEKDSCALVIYDGFKEGLRNSS